MAGGNRDLMDILMHGEPDETSVQQSLDDSSLLQSPGYGQQGVNFTTSVSLSSHGGTMQPPLASPLGQQSSRYLAMSPTQIMQSGGAMMQHGDMMGGQQYPTSASYADNTYQGYSAYPTQRRMPQASPTLDSYPGYNQNGSFMGGSAQSMGQYGAQSRALGHQTSMPNQYSPGSNSYSTQNYYPEGYPSMSPKSPVAHPMQSGGYPGSMQHTVMSPGQSMHNMPHSGVPSPGSSYPGASTYPSRASMSPVQKQMSPGAQAFFPSRSPVSQQIHSPPGMGSSYPRRSPTSPVGQPMIGMPNRSSTSPVSAMMTQAMYSMPQQYPNVSVNTTSMPQQYPNVSVNTSQMKQTSCMYAAQRLEKMSSQHQYKAQMAAATAGMAAASAGMAAASAGMTAAASAGMTPAGSSPAPSPGRRPSFPGQQNHTPGKHPMPSPSAPASHSGQASPSHVQRSPPQVGKSPPPFKPKKSSPPFHSRKSPSLPNPYQTLAQPVRSPVGVPKAEPRAEPCQRAVASESTSQMDVKRVQSMEKTNMQKLEEVAGKITPKFALELKEVSKGKEKKTEVNELNKESLPDNSEQEIKKEEYSSFDKEEKEADIKREAASPEEEASQGEECKEVLEKSPADGTTEEENEIQEKGIETPEDVNGESETPQQDESMEVESKDIGNGKTVVEEEPETMEQENQEGEQATEQESEQEKEHGEEKKQEDLTDRNIEKKIEEEPSKMDVEEAGSSDDESEIVKEMKVVMPPSEPDAKHQEEDTPKMENKSVTAKPWIPATKSGTPPTIQATVIAKGKTAQTNQQVLVAKTAGGQMYLIQGNVLIPVQNITVQQPKGKDGGRILCVNQGQGKTSQVVVGNLSPNLLQHANVKKEDSPSAASSKDDSDKRKEVDLSCQEEPIMSPSADSESGEFMTSVSIQTDRTSPKGRELKSPFGSPCKKHGKLERSIDALKAKLEQTSKETREALKAELDETSPDSKRRIGRPPGSKDKHKRKPYSHKKKDYNIDEVELSPERKKSKHEKRSRELSRQVKAAAATEAGPSTSHKRPLTIDIPTVSKTTTAAPKKRKILPPPQAPSRILNVQPRGGIDKGKWCCALCGKQSNFDTLGALYGPHKAKLSRERRDSISRECRSPDKLLSPSGRRPSDLPIELEGSEIELWVHNDCAVWSQGIYMLGRSLYGLEQAVETAVSHKCTKCTEVGATLACFRRGCNQIFHYACARASGCAFVEDNFTIFCSSHKGA